MKATIKARSIWQRKEQMGHQTIFDILWAGPYRITRRAARGAKRMICQIDAFAKVIAWCHQLEIGKSRYPDKASCSRELQCANNLLRRGFAYKSRPGEVRHRSRLLLCAGYVGANCWFFCHASRGGRCREESDAVCGGIFSYVFLWSRRLLPRSITVERQIFPKQTEAMILILFKRLMAKTWLLSWITELKMLGRLWKPREALLRSSKSAKSRIWLSNFNTLFPKVIRCTSKGMLY